MAQPPRLPEFDKAKFADEPLFAAFWEVVQPFLKLASQALKQGLTVSENIAGGWVDVEVTANQAFPLRIQSPLPAGLTPYGISCMGVWSSANPNEPILGPGGVQPDWVFDQGSIIIRKFTGELEGVAFRARLLVLAQ
jgi:hypothetical protein